MIWGICLELTDQCIWLLISAVRMQEMTGVAKMRNVKDNVYNNDVGRQ